MFKKRGFVLGIWPFFRSARHRDVNHCHEARPWGVWGWHDACRAVQRRFFVCFCPLQTSFRWTVCGASQTDPASAPLLQCWGFCSSRRFTNAFPAPPNSLLKVILNKSLSLPSSLSQRLLDRKIKRLPLPLIVIGSYSFGAFHTVFQGQKASLTWFSLLLLTSSGNYYVTLPSFEIAATQSPGFRCVTDKLKT